jgi:hypothetical protein
MEVLALPPHSLMGLGQRFHCFAPPITALLAPTYPTLGSLKRALCLSIAAGLEDTRTI